VCYLLVADELKTVMSLNFCDIVFQTWSFKMPKLKNVYLCKGIIPKYMHKS